MNTLSKVLLGALGASLVVIGVLAFLLSRKAREAASLLTEIAVKEAVIRQASAEADGVIAALAVEAAYRRTLRAEIDSLQTLLDHTKKRPIYETRPRPTDARGLRESIIGATHR